jgi:hypothetical protein
MLLTSQLLFFSLAVRANALKTFSSLSGFLDVTDYASPITAFCSWAHSLSRPKRDRSLHPLWYLLRDGKSGEFLPVSVIQTFCFNSIDFKY